MFKIKSIIVNFIQRVKNILRWFPVIWADREWDYTFIFKLLYKKLDYMEKFYLDDRRYGANAKDIAREINYAKNILKRLIDNNYMMIAAKEYDKKYKNKPVMTFETIDNRRTRLKWTDDKKQLEMFRKAHDRSIEMEQKDLDELFSFLRKNIEKWWD